MSIIQSIRERAAWLVFGLIAVSLIGFLLMDARRSNFFGGSDRPTAIGVVNGQKIQADEFNRQVANIEDGIKRQQNGAVSDDMRERIRQQVWDQDIRESLLERDYDALGMEVGRNEQNDLLAGQDIDPQVRQLFTDRKTGSFDPQLAAQNINQLLSLYKAGPRRGANADNSQYDMARMFWEDYVPQFDQHRLEEKFVALVANSAYVPKWMAEKVNADNSQIASISFVTTPYITVPDSAAKVSDAEIMEMTVNLHPAQFKQPESRSIAYVVFDGSPTSADSAHVFQQLVGLKKDFAATKDPASFLNLQGSETSFADTTLAKSAIHVPFKDSIFALTKGGLYGPYLDGGDYVVAKLVDEHAVPDSVEARHILIATVDPQSQQPLMDDTTGKKRIDSIRNLIEKGGQRFDSLAAHLSDDKSSAIKGGKLPWFGSGQMVKAFQDFAFGHKVGDKGVVKSEFGYHYIEVIGQKNFEPGYKVAYLSRKITASPETDQAASGLANQFAGESRDARAFEDNIQKDHLLRRVAPDISPAAISVIGIGPNRQLVQWVYGAEVGNVSQPYPVGNKYIVAQLIEINKAGTMSASRARAIVEPILRNRKKAELITKKLGSPASLDAAAGSSGLPVMHADSVNFSAGMLPNAGREPRVVGASFDKSLAGKPASPPIAGNSGVFVIRVEKVSALSNPNGDIQQQRFALEQQQRQLGYGIVEAMIKLADITDNRGKLF